MVKKLVEQMVKMVMPLIPVVQKPMGEPRTHAMYSLADIFGAQLNQYGVLVYVGEVTLNY